MPMDRVHANAKHQLLLGQLKPVLKKGQCGQKVVKVARLVEDENIGEHDRVSSLVRDALQCPRVAVVRVAIETKEKVDQKMWQRLVTEDLFVLVKPFKSFQDFQQIGITGGANMLSRKEKPVRF